MRIIAVRSRLRNTADIGVAVRSDAVFSSVTLHLVVALQLVGAKLRSIGESLVVALAPRSRPFTS